MIRRASSTLLETMLLAGIRTRFALLVATALLVVCCTDKDASAPVEARPVSLAASSGIGAEIFPLADGNAYLINSLESQLFFLSQGTAVRVQGVILGDVEQSIYPTATGAAYLISSDGSKMRLYYLAAATASEVKEVPDVAAAAAVGAASTEGFFWAQAQAATIRSRRIAADAEDRQTDDSARNEEP